MKIELHDSEFRSEFMRFSNLVGAVQWQRRVKVLRQQIRTNKMLREHLLSENSIAVGLWECEELLKKFPTIPSHLAAERGLHAAMVFVAQTLSIMETSPPAQARAMIGRVQGAIKNPDHMRGLRLELTAATHFLKRGYSIVWAEQAGFGRFDLLVEGMGSDGLEVECKSVSSDKGRKIHRYEAIEFHSLLQPSLSTFAQTLHVGLAAVVTVPDRLPEKLADRKALAEFVGRQILRGSVQATFEGVRVRIVEFDAKSVMAEGPGGTPLFDKEALERVTGTRNRSMMIVGGGSSGQGHITVVLQSELEDEFLARTFETVAESAKKQVTKSRPAHYFVQFDGLDTLGLREIAELELDTKQPPTPLRVSVSNLLNRDSYAHIIGIGLLSKSETIITRDGIVHSGGGGTVYNFPKRDSIFWREQFSGMFN